jgi:hypothetical protein
VKLSIDGQKAFHHFDKNAIQQPASKDTSYHFDLFSAGLFEVMVIPRLKLVVYWDKNAKVYVEAGPQWKGKVSCLSPIPQTVHGLSPHDPSVIKLTFLCLR